MKAFARSLADGIAGAVGAAAASQAPEFAQQYLQRLGGHRDEALRYSGQLKAQGRPADDSLVLAAQARVHELTQNLDALTASSDLLRPLALVRHVDLSIAAATLDAFRPAVPLGTAGLTYALIGVLLGILAIRLLFLPFRLSRRRWRRA